MIILNNPLDKASRDFVSQYGAEHTVLQYPECVDQYPYISAFPSVVVDVPDTCAIDLDGNPTAEIIPAHYELVRLPATWDDVDAYLAEVTARPKPE